MQQMMSNRPAGVECSPSGHQKEDAEHLYYIVMKKLRRYIVTGLLFPMIASCVSTEVPISPADSHDSPVIGFRSSLDTRATVNSIEEISGFKVLGLKRANNDESSWANVFNDESQDYILDVTKSGGSWTYADKKNWETEHSYIFHGFHATGANITPMAVLDVNGQLTGELKIENFNATQHVDLLYDVATRDYDTEGSAAVPFNFRHLLSKVTFVGKAEGALTDENNDIGVVLLSAKLCGIPTTGSWSSTTISDALPAGKWECGNIETVTKDNYNNYPFTEFNGGENGKELTSTGIDLFNADSSDGGSADDEIILFPQFSLDNIYFEITFHYTGNNVNTDNRTQYVHLGSVLNGPKSWDAGKSYKYTFTIGRNDYIFFAAPTVEPWEEINIGDSALDEEKETT